MDFNPLGGFLFVGITKADDGLTICRCGEAAFIEVRGGLPPGDNEYLGISNVEKCSSAVDSVTPSICFIVVDLSCRQKEGKNEGWQNV